MDDDNGRHVIAIAHQRWAKKHHTGDTANDCLIHEDEKRSLNVPIIKLLIQMQQNLETLIYCKDAVYREMEPIMHAVIISWMVNV
jgi:hypothetical protein